MEVDTESSSSSSPLFWSQSQKALSFSPPPSSSGIKTWVLVLFVSIFLILLIPSFPSSILKALPAKSRWDTTLNLALVVFAILCGLLGRRGAGEFEEQVEKMSVPLAAIGYSPVSIRLDDDDDIQLCRPSSSDPAIQVDNFEPPAITLSPPPPPPPPVPPRKSHKKEIATAIAQFYNKKRRRNKAKTIHHDGVSPPPPPLFSQLFSSKKGGSRRKRSNSISDHRSSPPPPPPRLPRTGIEDGGDAFCPSPDVNNKADVFIKRFRDGLKLEKLREKELQDHDQPEEAGIEMEMEQQILRMITMGMDDNINLI